MIKEIGKVKMTMKCSSGKILINKVKCELKQNEQLCF